MNSSQQQLSLKDQVLCLQRFIKNNRKKAVICRTLYKKESCNSCYLITNKKEFFDKEEPEAKRMVVKPDLKSTIVKSKQGIILKQTVKYLE